MGRIDRFDGDLKCDILDPLARARPDLITVTSGRPLRLIGPFPLYLGNHRRLPLARRLEQAVKSVGWRTLVLQDSMPVATVDCGIGPTGRKFNTVRREAAAQALRRALEGMRRSVGRQFRGTAGHAIRVLDMPNLGVSAVWKSGHSTLFMPVSERGFPRTATRILKLSAWRHQVVRHRARIARQQVHPLLTTGRRMR